MFVPQMVLAALVTFSIGVASSYAEVGKQKGKDVVVPDRNTSPAINTENRTPKVGPSGAGYNKDGSLYYPDTKKK